jgi:hypothetical protein
MAFWINYFKEVRMNKKVVLMVIILVLISLFILLAGCSNNQAPAKTATPQSTLMKLSAPQQEKPAAEQQYYNNVGEIVTSDNGYPIAFTPLSQEYVKLHTTLTNAELGINLEIEYGWSGMDFYAITKNNGAKTLKDGTVVHVSFYNEKHQADGLTGGFSVAGWKPGETRTGKWNFRDSKMKVGPDWTAGWSLRTK